MSSVMVFIRSEMSGRSSPPLQKCRKAAPPKKWRKVSTTVVLNQGGFDEVVSRVRWTLDPSEGKKVERKCRRPKKKKKVKGLQHNENGLGTQKSTKTDKD